MADRFLLEGRVAVVTGAGRGLGRFMAGVLAGAGASIVLLGRDGARLDEAAAEIGQETGVPTLAIAADVNDPAALAAAAEAAKARFGHVDILLNNSGVVTSDTLVETSEADWDRVVGTNLTGVWRTVKAFAPLMTAATGARIVNIGSVMSGRAAANRGPYAAAKAGLLNLARTLAIELGPQGITVNTICPSVIITDLNREQIEVSAAEAYRALLARVPARRWGEMEDLAGALLLFASDASGYISGQALYVDGGLTAC
ncbi:MAG: SDR family NAD(P)-dependent oxidoreductase [Sphingobium sp.]|nr:SDR family NAD(P)-dependent oxidoreductase [Sphingobium sp.]